MTTNAAFQSHLGQWSLYFDGLCPLCSREIAHYRTQKGAEALRFIDITLADFDASNEGLDPLAVHKVMHIKSPSGRLFTGVDAFIEIWRLLPRYKRMSQVAGLGFVKPVLNIGYQIFARVRPYLPRSKRQECEASPYCERKEAP